MALSDLVNKINDYFAEKNITVPYTNTIVPVLIGEKPVFLNHQSNRIVFVPMGGGYGPAKGIGRNPKSLRTWLSTADVHVWGFDGYGATSDPINKQFHNPIEAHHYEQTEVLHNQIQRAIYNCAHGTYQISNSRWVNTPKDKKYGKELIFTLQLEVPILDTPWQVINSDGYGMGFVSESDMIFNQGYQYSPPVPGGFVGLKDLDGNSTVDEFTMTVGCECETPPEDQEIT